ncbi:hypothetical protein BC629DRAFT_451111 [Irpex lacteus]|nr:hypothetical protein BC629DRAFT_451111 [Irpex lacteus]
MLDVATLKLLSRAEIQKLARANHIKANLKTVTIIELLVERSKNNEISGSVAVPTRATKVEPADPPIPEPEQPPPVEHSSNMDYGEPISAGMRALRVLDGDTTNRRDGCGSERVHEPDNENYAEIAPRVPDTTTSCGERSSIDERRLDLAPSLPSTGGQESSAFISGKQVL